jgi:rare lipoprotein A
MKTLFLAVTLMIFSVGCASLATKSPQVPTKKAPLEYYGKASYYGDKHQGKLTANGEIFDKNTLTCAHKKLPFETMCRVTNLANNKSVVVRVNDRGPFIQDRIIDLSYKAMEVLDGLDTGVIDVRVEIIE